MGRVFFPSFGKRPFYFSISSKNLKFNYFNIINLIMLPFDESKIASFDMFPTNDHQFYLECCPQSSSGCQ